MIDKLIQSILSIIATFFKKKLVVPDNEPNQQSSKKQFSKVGITEEDYQSAANALNCSVEAIKAFAKVESRGSGFLSNGNPVILFERHIFYRFLKQKGIVCNDTSICSSRTGGYLGGSREHERLERAIEVDRDAALQSASWGMFQVMAFNWKACGYDSLQDFINAAYRSESDHLNMFVGFIKANKTLADAVRNKNWDIAARIYNGPGYKKNKYDTKLAEAYEKEVSKRGMV